MRAVILKPLVNEKSMSLVKGGFYTFAVDRNATKELIGKIVKEKFNVDVLSVKTINVKSKTKMQRTRKGYFETQNSKKAIVKVKKGQRIALFEEATRAEEEEVKVTTAEGEKVVEVKEKKGLLSRVGKLPKFGGPKVKVEAVENQEKAETKSDTKRPTKTSQKEAKKGR
jgi:ribosomal protein L23